MPEIMEISGTNGEGQSPTLMDLRQVLALQTIERIRKRRAKAAKARQARGRPRRARPAVGMTAEKALELAERFLREQRKPLAIAWARQAENRAKAEGRTAIARRAQEIVKQVRGEVTKMMAAFGDIDGIVMGRLMGLW